MVFGRETNLLLPLKVLFAAKIPKEVKWVGLESETGCFDLSSVTRFSG